MSAARISALEDRVAELETEVKTLRRANGSGHSCELLAGRLNAVEGERDASKARIQRVLHGELGLYDYNRSYGETLQRDYATVALTTLQRWIDVLEGRA